MNNISKVLQGLVMQYEELVSPSAVAELGQGAEESWAEVERLSETSASPPDPSQRARSVINRVLITMSDLRVLPSPKSFSRSQ